MKMALGCDQTIDLSKTTKGINMTKKFATAEEYKALPLPEREALIEQIACMGYDADVWDYIDLQDEREVYAKLKAHYTRLEKLAYAIGDDLRAYFNGEFGDVESDAPEADEDMLHEFMSKVAEECEQSYCGEYHDHDDGFWVASNC
jgi:hypothetical protein